MPEHMIVPVEWKAAVGGPGELDGYASVFGNVDRDGDVVLPGAFKKTLADWSRSKQPLPLIADHELSTDGVIGSVHDAREDGVGLRVKARFSSDAKAQSIRTKMVEGHLKGMSFTYQTIRHFPGQMAGKSARFLQELKLFEVTVSPFPINELATASAKAGDPKKPYGDVPYADPGYQSDGKKRYPLTADKVVAAWSYINQADNAGKYSSEQLSLIKGRIRAAMKKFGHQVSEAASLDFAEFSDLMVKALSITYGPASKAAADLLVAAYLDQAAVLSDEQDTAAAAAPDEGTAVKADYSLAFMPHPPEPHDGALDPLAPLETQRTNAELDRVEAVIKAALGAHNG